MTNEEKQRRIRQWIDPEERVTVQFLDAPDLNAAVVRILTGVGSHCTTSGGGLFSILPGL